MLILKSIALTILDRQSYDVVYIKYIILDILDNGLKAHLNTTIARFFPLFPASKLVRKM